MSKKQNRICWSDKSKKNSKSDTECMYVCTDMQFKGRLASLQVFDLGRQNRSTGATRMNIESSRSHALLCVSVVGHNLTTGIQTFGKPQPLPPKHIHVQSIVYDVIVHVCTRIYIRIMYNNKKSESHFRD